MSELVKSKFVFGERYLSTIFEDDFFFISVNYDGIV